MSLRRFFRRGQWDRERSEEIESYLRIETDENVARGLAYDEARAAALRKLGSSALIREEIYRMNTLAFLDALVRDQIMAMKTTFTPGHYRRRVAGVLARRLVQRLFESP